MNKQTFKVERSWIFETKRDFAMRWKLEMMDDQFFERCIKLIHKVVGKGTNFDQLSDEIFLLVGKIDNRKYTIKKSSLADIVAGGKEEIFCFNDTEVFRLLQEKKSEIPKFLEILEYILNFRLKSKDDELLREFNDVILLSNKPIHLIYNEGYKFFPSDIEIFDKKLIDDVLEFLKDYPEAHRELSEALRLYLQQGSYKDCIDKTRCALEIFIKKLLRNDKSLENQEQDLFKYFDSLLDQNIKTMFRTILNCYTTLNNNRAKHIKQDSQPFKNYEVEFLFYLVGNFLRLFMKINQEKDKKD